MDRLSAIAFTSAVVAALGWSALHPVATAEAGDADGGAPRSSFRSPDPRIRLPIDVALIGVFSALTYGFLRRVDPTGPGGSTRSRGDVRGGGASKPKTGGRAASRDGSPDAPPIETERFQRR